MPVWLNTRGKGNLGIGLCDRCHFKFSIEDLVPDDNSPGLKVCRKCVDQFDPYRLPARRPDDLTLPFYRPILPVLTFETPAEAIDGLSNADADLWIQPESPYGPPDGGMYGIEVTE